MKKIQAIILLFLLSIITSCNNVEEKKDIKPSNKDVITSDEEVKDKIIKTDLTDEDISNEKDESNSSKEENTNKEIKVENNENNSNQKIEINNNKIEIENGKINVEIDGKTEIKKEEAIDSNFEDTVTAEDLLEILDISDDDLNLAEDNLKKDK